jgi:hypothetical protein
MGTKRGIVDPPVAFCVRSHGRPWLEVRVNFGVFAGREATPAEIDRLGRALHAGLESFAIVAEVRHEFGGEVEATVHQVVIEVDEELHGEDWDALCKRVLAAAHAWADACIAARHSELGEL